MLRIYILYSRKKFKKKIMILQFTTIDDKEKHKNLK